MNSNEYKVLKTIYESDKSLFFRAICKKANISIGGAQQVFKDYKDFIIKKRDGKNTYYTLKNNLNGFYLKSMIELKKTQRFLEKNALLEEFLAYLVKNNIPALIFGSYAKGNPSKNSDLDILILSKKDIPKHLCPVDIHPIIMTTKQYEKSIGEKIPLILEIKENHILISYIDYFISTLGGKNGKD